MQNDSVSSGAPGALEGSSTPLRSLPPGERLYRHSARPSWGVGLWVDHDASRRRIRFEDGQIRTFKEGFFDMLVPVDPDTVDVDELFERLVGEHELLKTEEARSSARSERPPVMSFADQVRVFQHMYPKGFEDPAYIGKWRNPGEGRVTKKHLDPAIEQAQQVLSAESLAQGDMEETWSKLVDVFGSTSAVGSKRLKSLKAIDDNDARQAIIGALHELLHSEEGRYRVRFDSWVQALANAGVPVNWRLATVVPALVGNHEHVRVRRTVFDQQAREVLPEITVPTQVSGVGYRRAKRIASATRRKLGEAGMEPKDMLDLSVFIWETLRPSGQKVLDEL